MGKTIGIWNESVNQAFDYTLVAHEEYEYLEVFLDDNSVGDCQKLKLKPSVSKNPEIFAWYIASKLSNSNSDIEIDTGCQNCLSGYLISLLSQFFQAFHIFDTNCCNKIVGDLSKVDFHDFYMYRTKWLLDEMLNYAAVFQEAFLETSPMNFLNQDSYRQWWNQPLIIRQVFNQLETRCDLVAMEGINVLRPLADTYKRIDRGLGQWAALRGLEKLEAASGYFLALGEFWLTYGNFQMALLCVHRSIDCALLLIGHRERKVFPTVNGLIDDSQNHVSFTSVFWSLYRTSSRVFSNSERSFILDLNDCRNYLRETHGFRVVQKNEVEQFILSSHSFLKSLQPDIKAYSYRDKFRLDHEISMDIIFDVEIDIESYIEIIAGS
jgi:hypothetical protein